MILTVLSVIYVAIAMLVFRFLIKSEKSILGTKMGRRHPERFKDPMWLHVIVAALWPLQIVGFFAGISRG